MWREGNASSKNCIQSYIQSSMQRCAGAMKHQNVTSTHWRWSRLSRTTNMRHCIMLATPLPHLATVPTAHTPRTRQWCTLWAHPLIGIGRFLTQCEDSFPNDPRTLQNLSFLGNPESWISSCSWNNLGAFWKFLDSLETQNPSHSWMTLEPFGNSVSLTSQIPQKLGIPNTDTEPISIINNPTLDLYS